MCPPLRRLHHQYAMEDVTYNYTLASGKLITELKVAELKAELEQRGENKYGNKKELLERLQLCVRREQSAAAGTAGGTQAASAWLQSEADLDNDFIREYLRSQQDLLRQHDSSPQDSEAEEAEMGRTSKRRSESGVETSSRRSSRKSKVSDEPEKSVSKEIPEEEVNKNDDAKESDKEGKIKISKAETKPTDESKEDAAKENGSNPLLQKLAASEVAEPLTPTRRSRRRSVSSDKELVSLPPARRSRRVSRGGSVEPSDDETPAPKPAAPTSLGTIAEAAESPEKRTDDDGKPGGKELRESPEKEVSGIVEKNEVEEKGLKSPENRSSSLKSPE